MEVAISLRLAKVVIDHYVDDNNKDDLRLENTLLPVVIDQKGGSNYIK